MPKARPTIRCLNEELAEGLDDAEQRSALLSGRVADLGPMPLCHLSHPLLRKVDEQITGINAVDLHDHEISAVTDVRWYRVKFERMRAAVWVDPEGIPWICMAGHREDGAKTDFYAQFEHRCANGSSILLPTEADRQRLRLERSWDADDARVLLLRARVVSAILEAHRTAEVQSVDLPTALDPETYEVKEGAKLTVDLVADGEELGELTLSMRITDYVGTRYDDAVLEVRSAVPGVPSEDWDVMPAIRDHVDPCWFAVMDLDLLRRIREEVARMGLEVFVQSPPDLTDGPDGFTHIVRTHGLADATIDGAVVRAVCGRRFVPQLDPDGRTSRGSTPASGSSSAAATAIAASIPSPR